MGDLTGEHLTTSEIDGLIGGESPAGISRERSEHAETCQLCKRAIDLHRKAYQRLRQIKDGPREANQAGCPSTDELASLAAGLVDPARRQVLLDHASRCDACGMAFRAVIENFSDETNAEEAQMIEKLESSKPEWKSGMASQMAVAACPAQPIQMPIRTRPATWLGRAAAVLIALGAGGLGWNYWIEGQPAHLIAKAYTQQRPFEYRLPEAAFAPVRVQRSAQQKPAALLEAEFKLKRELEKRTDDVQSLDLMAQAQMLDSEPDAAIATLQHALESKPDDPDLLAALGMAYALRAQTLDRTVDYGSAIENLKLSLKAKPDSPVAVFNLALVYERMYMYPSAIEQWRHYLDLDKSGDWNKDAQRRLAELEQKKK